MEVRLFEEVAPPPLKNGGSQGLGPFRFPGLKDYFSLNVLNTVSDFDYHLFDPVTNPAQAPYSTDITSVGGKTYASVFNEVVNNGYEIEFIKIYYPDPATAVNQRREEMYKWYRDSNGQDRRDPLILLNAIDVYQENLNVINLDLRQSPMMLDGTNYLIYRMLKDVELTLFFFYRRVQKSTALDEMKKYLHG
ncbi:MAG TPA: hypothetical protein PKZ07_14665 [Sedimentisphaerales bacterium]|nr:hypothetical protein [Sedimentisphaerales bacterium]